jgi:phospholipid transport system substrate-binding protein
MNKPYYKNLRIVVFLYLISHISVAIGLTADEIVYETTQEVLNRLEIDKDRLQAEKKYIKVIVRELIMPHMDFNTMSALALGGNWDILNGGKQACLSRGFKNLLVERYAHVLLSYRDHNIFYQTAKPIGEKDYVSVIQTLTRTETKSSTIEYRMHPDGNSWKVADLLIDNVSLIRNYRKIFHKEIKQNGLVDFIKSFKECSS